MSAKFGILTPKQSPYDRPARYASLSVCEELERNFQVVRFRIVDEYKRVRIVFRSLTAQQQEQRRQKACRSHIPAKLPPAELPGIRYQGPSTSSPHFQRIGAQDWDASL